MTKIAKEEIHKVTGGEQNDPVYCKHAVNETCYRIGCSFCHMVLAEDGTENGSGYQCDRGYQPGVNIDNGTGYVK